jgi:hypothetical protein
VAICHGVARVLSRAVEGNGGLLAQPPQNKTFNSPRLEGKKLIQKKHLKKKNSHN